MLKAASRKGLVVFLLLVFTVVFSGCLLSRDPGEPEPPEPRVLFFDDFEDGLQTDWEHFSAFVLPETVGGKVVIETEKTGAVVSMSNPEWTDYAVEVVLSVDGSVPEEGENFYRCPQIVFRVENWNHFYLVAFSDTLARLYKREGSPSFLRQGSYQEGIVLGEDPIHVRVEVKGDNIKVIVNGYECINHTDDDPLNFGGAGIQGWNAPPNNAKWIFDDFAVYEID